MGIEDKFLAEDEKFWLKDWNQKIIMDPPHVIALAFKKLIDQEWIDKWFEKKQPVFISSNVDEGGETYMLLGGSYYSGYYLKRIRKICRVLDEVFNAASLEYYANKQSPHVCLIIAGQFVFILAPRIEQDETNYETIRIVKSW